MAWRVARSLDVLLGEINKAAPKRSKISDGSIGDAAHASRSSDHNPWVIDNNGIGVVRARDFTHDPADGCDAGKIAEGVRQLGIKGHPALKSGSYVIWNRRIASASNDGQPWDWEPYSGSNPHDHHCHVSVSVERAGYDSEKAWNVMAAPKPPKPQKIRVVTHNVWVGQSRASLRANGRRLIKRTRRPHIIVWEEAGRFKGTLPGYNRFATEGDSTEAGGVIIFVREDGEVSREYSVRGGDHQWRGPKHGKLHDPREFPGVSVYFEDAGWWDILGVHRVWTGLGKRNMNAWVAEDHAIGQWVARRREDKPHRPVVVVGDMNSRFRSKHNANLRALARRIKGWVLVSGIDGAVVVGAKGTTRKLFRKFGSDGHRPVVLTLTKETNAERTPRNRCHHHRLRGRRPRPVRGVRSGAHRWSAVRDPGPRCRGGPRGCRAGCSPEGDPGLMRLELLLIAATAILVALIAFGFLPQHGR